MQGLWPEELAELVTMGWGGVPHAIGDEPTLDFVQNPVAYHAT